MTRPNRRAATVVVATDQREAQTVSIQKDSLTQFITRVWNEGDPEAANDLVADTYTIHNDPGDPWDGQTLDLEVFKDRLITSRAVAPDQTFDIIQMIEEGTKIAMACSWTGTHLGDLPGLPATGRTLKMTGLTIYGFEGGRLSGQWQVADRLGIYQQMIQPRDP